MRRRWLWLACAPLALALVSTAWAPAAWAALARALATGVGVRAAAPARVRVVSLAHGEPVQAEHISATRIVLRRRAGRRVIWRDATDAPTFRRLSVQLRWERHPHVAG